jgi:hypothetical protein
VKTTLTSDSFEYAIAFVDKQRKVYALMRDGRFQLPRLSISAEQRAARAIQEKIHQSWGLQIVVLDLLPGGVEHGRCAIAYLICGGPEGVALKPCDIRELGETELSCDQRMALNHLFNENTDDPICRLTWFEEAVTWVESTMGSRVQVDTTIRQLNAGNGFMLLEFTTSDGRPCWLKTTRDPNRHECATTQFLSNLVDQYQLTPRPLPMLYGVKPEWNALLLSGDASALSAVPLTFDHLYARLKQAVEALARLQSIALGHENELIEHGAFDHRISSLQSHFHRIAGLLSESQPVDSHGDRSKDGHLAVESFERASTLLGALEIPETVLHGDLNWGNLVFSSHCQLIDWSEARIGHPLIALWHMLMLARVQDEDCRRFLYQSLCEDYCSVWRNSGVDSRQLQQAFVYAPFLAAVSALYARTTWFLEERKTLSASTLRIWGHVLREAQTLQSRGAL